MNEAVTNEREPTLCPICGVDRATSDGCEHLAHVRFDDIDFTEVSFVFCSSDDEVGYTFDELYLAVLHVAMIWLAGGKLVRKAIEKRLKQLGNHRD